MPIDALDLGGTTVTFPAHTVGWPGVRGEGEKRGGNSEEDDTWQVWEMTFRRLEPISNLKR